VFFYSFGETLLVEPTLNITFIIIFNYIRDHNKYESIDLQP
ncbi:TPA: oligosaccharide repeat unit polymerase, partial [Escherichia coli]